MKTWRGVAVVLMAGCMLLLTAQGAARAGGKEGKKSPKQLDAENAEKALRLLTSSPAMAEFGRKEKAPKALIAAGAMLLVARSLGGEPRDYDGAVVDAKGNKVDEPAERVKSMKDQAAALFDEAIDLARTSAEAKALGAMIKATQARVNKVECRAAETPLQVTRKVRAGGDHQYTLKFETKSPASVAFHSTDAVRFEVLEPGPGKVFELVGTSGQYTWSPKGEGAIKHIKIQVRGIDRMAQYTVYAK